MSSMVSRRPSRMNRSNDATWMSIRFGTSMTRSSFEYVRRWRGARGAAMAATKAIPPRGDRDAGSGRRARKAATRRGGEEAARNRGAYQRRRFRANARITGRGATSDDVGSTAEIRAYQTARRRVKLAKSLHRAPCGEAVADAAEEPYTGGIPAR